MRRRIATAWRDLSRRVDGHDYIPRVFDDWVTDAGSTFQAADSRHRRRPASFEAYGPA